MTGDAADMLARLRALLPPWFPSQGQAPVLDGVLTGIATTLSYIYSLYAYTILQTRIATATDAWLDIIAWTYFGGRFPRNPGETDLSFRGRILAELIRPRVTRAAIQAAVAELTGYPVRVIEPFATTDTGAWKLRGSGAPISFYRADTIVRPALWSGRGLRCQFFIQCVLPPIFGQLALPAYGLRGSGDGVVGAFWQARGSSGATSSGVPFISRGDVSATRGAAAVYALINAMRAAGVTCWVQFVPVPTAVTWDEQGAIWDQSGAKWDI
jgi:hypothetical protein